MTEFEIIVYDKIEKTVIIKIMSYFLHLFFVYALLRT